MRIEEEKRRTSCWRWWHASGTCPLHDPPLSLSPSLSLLLSHCSSCSLAFGSTRCVQWNVFQTPVPGLGLQSWGGGGVHLSLSLSLARLAVSPSSLSPLSPSFVNKELEEESEGLTTILQGSEWSNSWRWGHKDGEAREGERGGRKEEKVWESFWRPFEDPPDSFAGGSGHGIPAAGPEFFSLSHSLSLSLSSQHKITHRNFPAARVSHSLPFLLCPLPLFSMLYSHLSLSRSFYFS